MKKEFYDTAIEDFDGLTETFYNVSESSRIAHNYLCEIIEMVNRLVKDGQIREGNDEIKISFSDFDTISTNTRSAVALTTDIMSDMECSRKELFKAKKTFVDEFGELEEVTENDNE